MAITKPTYAHTPGQGRPQPGPRTELTQVATSAGATAGTAQAAVDGLTRSVTIAGVTLRFVGGILVAVS